MRIRNPDRPARRPICRVPDLQHSAGSGGCRPQRGIQRLHTRHQPFLGSGADGIARLWDTLEADGIAQTGSYKTEADSTKPLVIDSPTGGGKLGLVTGTVSLNGMTATRTGRWIVCAKTATRITTATSSAR